MAPGPARRVSYLFRVAWWASAILALAGPLLLVRRVGLDETWDAFNRYTASLLEFSGGHQIRVPGPGHPDGGRGEHYTRMDADLIHWHKEMTVLHNRIGSMAVVGKVDADGLDIEFNRPAALKGARKGGGWRAVAREAAQCRGCSRAVRGVCSRARPPVPDRPAPWPHPFRLPACPRPLHARLPAALGGGAPLRQRAAELGGPQPPVLLPGRLPPAQGARGAGAASLPLARAQARH